MDRQENSFRKNDSTGCLSSNSSCIECLSDSSTSSICYSFPCSGSKSGDSISNSLENTYCPEDCSKKCKHFNLYWFGSSFTDISNGRLNFGLQPYTVNTTTLKDCVGYSQGLGPCARSSDGKIYPQYIAEDLGMEINMEYDMDNLPRKKNKLISFSLTGACQTGNTVLSTPLSEYGYDWQVSRYLELYEKSKHKVSLKKDIFMYTDVGINDLLYLLNLFIDGTPIDPILYMKAYTDQVLANVTKLYSLGEAMTIFVQLVDAATVLRMPIFKSLSCVLPDTIGYLMELYDKVQKQLNNDLTALVLGQPYLNLTVLTTSDIYENLSVNSGLYGIVNDGKTMVDLGWPVKKFENQLWFDSLHLSSQSNRIAANYVKTWFQKKICCNCQ
jgi:hypothetical protein